MNLLTPLESLSAIHATLLVGILLECFLAVAWFFTAALLPSVRRAALHWAGFAFLQGVAFFLYLNSGHWTHFPVNASANMLLMASLVLQVRGLRQATGERMADRTLLGLLVLAALMQGAWLAHEHSPWRIAAISMLAGALCAWNAATLLRSIRLEGPQAPRLLGPLLSVPFVISSIVFALRSALALLFPELLIRDNRIDQTVSMAGALAWLFLSLSMAMALAGVVLHQLERKLSRAATHDALTGLPNRRAADDFMAQEALRAQRQGTPLSALMVDIDFFKKVNDQLGHAAGDHVLQTLARLLQERARATDLASRWGGEEFLVLLPDTPPTGALELAEQLRQAVQSAPFVWQQKAVPVTISIGAATWISGPFHANALIAQADAALYDAKRSGRNCVRLADDSAAGT